MPPRNPADRPATEPRTEAGRLLADEPHWHDPHCAWLQPSPRACDCGLPDRILAIEAEAAQGAAPPHHTVIERLDRPGNRANLERAEPPAGTFFTERCSGIVCIHGDCKRHSQYGEMYCGEHGGPPEYVSDSEGAAPRAAECCGHDPHGDDPCQATVSDWGDSYTGIPCPCDGRAAPRAEGLPVERLARAIKSRYGLKESESEVSIFLNAIFGSGEAGHD